MPDYRPPWYLPGRHLQTIVPTLLPWPCVAYERRQWTTDDGDFIDVDWAGVKNRKGLVVLFHGLEGNSGSRYARVLGARATADGWRYAVPHFRGCSVPRNPRIGCCTALPNLVLRNYHAGDWEEVGWMLAQLVDENEGEPVFAVGVSLGGSALLNWLARRGPAAADLVKRAVAIATPLNLLVTGGALERGFSSLYARTFLRCCLRSKALGKLRLFEGAYDRRCVQAAATLRDFDDAVTAPVHGFADVIDYWTKASAGPLLEKVRVPTLLINARNDPFTPRHVLRGIKKLKAAGKVPQVELDFPSEGGHAGFAGDGNWLGRRVLAFLSGQAWPAQPALNRRARGLSVRGHSRPVATARRLSSG
jgi:predicted alpha/beta-fold hydrolase